jgi:hypothetical protein
MKKVLIGCGIVALLFFVLIAAGGYMLYRAGKSMVEFGQKIEASYRATNTQYPFHAPDDNLVANDQLTRWIAIREKLIPQVASFKEMMEGNKTKNPFTMFGTMMEQSSLFVDAHVRELDAKKMSAHEYFWISRHVLTALNSGDARKDPALKDVVDWMDKTEQQMNKNNNRGGLNNLFVPMTGKEIAETLVRIQPFKQKIIDTRDVIMSDIMVAPMLGAFTQINEQETHQKAAREQQQGLKPADAAD